MRLLFVALGIVIVVAPWYATTPAQTLDAPLAVGQVYEVVWGCLPQIGCYGEVLRIEAIRADGWIDVLQCDKTGCTEKWRVNLAQAMSIRPYTLGRPAD